MPKPKRNFLKENKLKIREIQKVPLAPDKYPKGSARFEKRGSISSARSNSNCVCPCNCGVDDKIPITQQKTHGCVTKTIKVCDQEIQTDEINDENFLLSSLKKCTGNEVQSLVLKENGCEDDDDILSQNFQTLEINQNSIHHNGINSERNTTNRSNATRYSTVSRKRDIKLPKYLEKEKREKEEQRLRDELKDPNCPAGHYALLEDERESCLKSAEKSEYLNFTI